MKVGKLRFTVNVKRIVRDSCFSERLTLLNCYCGSLWLCGERGLIMKECDVKINQIYTARINGHISRVLIWAASEGGGFWGTDLGTGNKVHIKRARKLRERVLNKCFP